MSLWIFSLVIFLYLVKFVMKCVRCLCLFLRVWSCAVKFVSSSSIWFSFSKRVSLRIILLIFFGWMGWLWRRKLLISKICIWLWLVLFCFVFLIWRRLKRAFLRSFGKRVRCLCKVLIRWFVFWLKLCIRIWSIFLKWFDWVWIFFVLLFWKVRRLKLSFASVRMAFSSVFSVVNNMRLRVLRNCLVWEWFLMVKFGYCWMFLIYLSFVLMLLVSLFVFFKTTVLKSWLGSRSSKLKWWRWLCFLLLLKVVMCFMLSLLVLLLKLVICLCCLSWRIWVR